MKWISIISLLVITTLQVTFAAPKKIYIIRHGDKLLQPTPGPTLSAQGYVRAMAFARYFITNYPQPDVIIAANPTSLSGKNSSIRELQTVAVFANQLAALHPKDGYPIMHPLPSSEYAQLAKSLLNDPRFNHQSVLICWDHTVIPQLANALGVKEKLAPWNSSDFDSVFILEYNDNGKLQKFNQLKNQYPVPAITYNWDELYQKISAK